MDERIMWSNLHHLLTTLVHDRRQIINMKVWSNLNARIMIEYKWKVKIG